MLRTSFTRRHVLGGGAAITTLLASQKVARAQSQAPKIAVAPPRPARDRLEEALTRIADPNGEGARTCLFVSRRRLGWVYPCGTFENFCAMETQTINSRVAVQSRRGKGPASCQGSPRYVPPWLGE